MKTNIQFRFAIATHELKFDQLFTRLFIHQRSDGKVIREFDLVIPGSIDADSIMDKGILEIFANNGSYTVKRVFKRTQNWFDTEINTQELPLKFREVKLSGIGVSDIRDMPGKAHMELTFFLEICPVQLASTPGVPKSFHVFSPCTGDTLCDMAPAACSLLVTDPSVG